MSTQTFIFKAVKGSPHGATYNAEKWLTDNGFSYGPGSVDGPAGVIKGDAIISKWRNMTRTEQKSMDGHLWTGYDRDARLEIKTKATLMNETERLDAANQFIRAMGETGRCFFYSDDNGFASLDIDERGRVWFTDDYSQKRIYTHYNGRWKGFTGGGTLKTLVECLRDFIKHGKFIRSEYFDCNENGEHHWGYDPDAMVVVKAAAIDLGFAVPSLPTEIISYED